MRCDAEEAEMSVRLYTIGHSTRTLEELVALLRENEIGTLVDVRAVPRSRRVPQFNSDALARDLPPAGLHYVHMNALGGLRHPRKDSRNTGWRNASFRGYADYMETDEFRGALAELLAMATKERVAIMCAEAVPWRCHRSLIADAASVLHGADVLHIMGPGKANPHKLTAFLQKDEKGEFGYPGQMDMMNSMDKTE